MRHDQAGDFRGLPGFFFAGLRAHRDRQCQACQTELITGEPVFRISASFKAVVNNKYSNGAYCTPCAVAQMEEMKAKLAEASAWLTDQHKVLESYFVAKALGGKQDRCKLTAMLRKLVPKHLCSRCFHDKSEHQHFYSEACRYENGVSTKYTYVSWKCTYTDDVVAEPNSTVQCCGCNHGPKIKQPEQAVTEEKK